MIIYKEKAQTTINSLVLTQQGTENYEEYKGLRIYKDYDIVETDDSRSGTQGAKYVSQIVFPKLLSSCVGKKCEFPSPEATYRGTVYIHTLKWFNEKYPDKSEECLRCQISCLKIHEHTHHKLAIDNGKGIVKDCWDEFLKKLQSTLECCESKDCNKKWKQWITEVNFCVNNRLQATEEAALQAQKDCLNRNCVEKCQMRW